MAVKYSYPDVIKKLDELPTLPSIVYELNRIINDPMSSTNEVEEIMSTDMALTARVLKLANSAYYAIPGGCSNLSRAIAYLGFDTVSQLVMSASIIDALIVETTSEFDISEFWKHCIGVGVAAETIAKRLRHPTPSDLFSAGLVHDMGKLALCAYDPNVPVQISKFATSNKISFLDAENKLDLPAHTEIGSQLAEKWKLPQHMLCPVKYHHEPNIKLRGDLSSDQNRNVDIVYLANLVVHALKFGGSGHNKIQSVPGDLMGRLGMTAKDDFLSLAKQVKDSLDQSAEFIQNLLGNK